MSAGVVIGLDGLDELVKVVVARGFRAVGPVVADGAITLREIEEQLILKANVLQLEDLGLTEFPYANGFHALPSSAAWALAASDRRDGGGHVVNDRRNGLEIGKKRLEIVI